MQTAIGHARILGTPVSATSNSSSGNNTGTGSETTLARIQHALQRQQQRGSLCESNNNNNNSSSVGMDLGSSSSFYEEPSSPGRTEEPSPSSPLIDERTASGVNEQDEQQTGGSNNSNTTTTTTTNNTTTPTPNTFESMEKLLSSPESLGVAELHRTLERFRKESQDTIQKLKQESMESSRTIEKLQQQLQQQSDYDHLKQEIQLLKGGLGGSGGSLEMILLERAKALSAFQPSSPGHFQLPGRPLFPPIPGLDHLNEELLSQWKRGLEHQAAALLSPAGSSTPPPQSQQQQPRSRPSPSASPNSHGRCTASPQQQRQSSSPVGNGKPLSSSEEEGSEINNPLPFPGQMATLLLPHHGGHHSVSPHPHPHHPHHQILSSSNRIPKSDPMEARLQDMLRYNMEKYAGQALDTLGTSRRVRELLSIHNIGQRLFAKYVLGLSQGTVSELLSKPKSWEKLTEKGRDSYRKMHAWAYDEQAVLLLKTLIPRKGELVRPAPTAALLMKDQSAMRSSFPYGAPPPPGSNNSGNNEATEERIAKILGDASKAAPKDEESLQSAQERMSKIYTEELARLMNQGGKDLLTPSSSHPGSLFPGPFAAAAAAARGGGPLAPSPQEIQRAMDIYQQELGRIQQNAFAAAISAQNGNNHNLNNNNLNNLNNNNNNICKDQPEESAGGPPHTPPQPLTVVSSAETSPSIKMETKVDSAEDAMHAKTSSLFPNLPPVSGVGLSNPPCASGSASPVSGIPGMESISAAAAAAASLSPLQRMASITNSLVTQAPTTASACGSTRPNRAILPPITQQQFDRFSHLNTDDTVRRIRDILSQYSISQRLFGENILGLSQGSVSDLLARPKPWHMLTQKGREPFIRMKLFLEDEHAVHKLVASQYKIAPEKLMRTGGYSGNPNYPPTPKQMPKLPADFPKSLMESPHSAAAAAALNTSSSSSSRDNSFPEHLGSPLLDPLAIHRKILAQQQKSVAAAAAAATLPGGGGNISGNPSSNSLVPSPSLYEMAALTQELDTQAITTKAKEVLLANNLFGESVLGLSQGSVSELLSKPKPWHMLSIKGREPFIRMQLWLNDPQNIEKLQLLKNEKLSKRKRGSGDSNSGDDRSSPAEAYASEGGASSPGGAPPKKPRALFTEEQKEGLKVAFALDPYPSNATHEFLGQELNLEARSIANWFHNHRMRLKQHLPGAAENLALLSGKEGVHPFDPIKFRLLFHQRLLEITGAEESVSRLLRQMSTGGLDLRRRQSNVPHSSEEDEEPEEEPEEYEDGEERETIHQPSSGPASNATSSSSRSRRKAAAPQWVRPDWMEDSNEANEASNPLTTAKTSNSSSAETINGVCVLNRYAFKEDSANQAATSGPVEPEDPSPKQTHLEPQEEDEEEDGLR